MPTPCKAATLLLGCENTQIKHATSWDCTNWKLYPISLRLMRFIFCILHNFSRSFHRACPNFTTFTKAVWVRIKNSTSGLWIKSMRLRFVRCAQQPSERSALRSCRIKGRAWEIVRESGFALLWGDSPRPAEVCKQKHATRVGLAELSCCPGIVYMSWARPELPPRQLCC